MSPEDPACPSCGYSLAALNSTTCPECGYTAESNELELERERRLFMRVTRFQWLTGWMILVPGAIWLAATHNADPWDSFSERLVSAAFVLTLPALTLFLPVAIESIRFVRHFPTGYRAVALRLWLMSVYHLNWVWATPIAVIAVSTIFGLDLEDAFDHDPRLVLPFLFLGLGIGVVASYRRWKGLVLISGMPKRWHAMDRFRRGLVRCAFPIATLLLALSLGLGMMWLLDELAPDWRR